MTVIPCSYDISPETLERVRGLVKEDFKGIVSLFKVLSDSTRLKILRALEGEGLCVCVFVEVLDCKYSALSYHLKLLKEADLVDFSREGNFLTYRLTDLGREVLARVNEVEDML
ncbi:MAG TPA: ArsR family transcriptional regulator [Candidatus Methanoperedenaceae archaeon]|nr:ArsR family transcriptional regulator [Candidatus Methanoperedenaceae archaeon]